MNEKDDRDDILVGWGKHANLKYVELMAQKGYVEWLQTQEWFPYQHPELYDYLVDHGIVKKRLLPTLAYSESDVHQQITYMDHNEFQALFVETENIKKLLSYVKEISQSETYFIESIIFEDLCNADIVIKVRVVSSSTYLFKQSTVYVFLIELKPTVSNDYPEILRQMRAQRRAYERCYDSIYMPQYTIVQLLVTLSYTGKVDVETVRKMYGDVRIVIYDV